MLWYITQKEGGLALPNIKLYYISYQLRHIPDITANNKHVICRDFEFCDREEFMEIIFF